MNFESKFNDIHNDAHINAQENNLQKVKSEPIRMKLKKMNHAITKYIHAMA